MSDSMNMCDIVRVCTLYTLRVPFMGVHVCVYVYAYVHMKTASSQ